MEKTSMNLLKMSLFISTLIFSHTIMANICVNTSSNYKMFGSVLRSGALVRGHELAFQDNSFSDYQLFSAESDAELVKQIQNISTGSCSIVLGLFTSRECLIAGPIFKKNKLIGISSSCSSDNIKQFTPYLFTIIPPLSKFSYEIANYLNKRKDLGKVILIYQPTDVYSQLSYNYFKEKFNNSSLDVQVDSDGQFNLNTFDFTSNEKLTIIFFTYPLPSAKILMELNKSKIIKDNTIIVGASSWTFDISVFKPIKEILNKSSEVIAADVIDWNKIKKSEFIKRFTSKYNREPLNIEILTYDVTKLSIECYKKSLSKNQYSIARFKHCMTETNHHGVSGNFNFSKNSSFAERPLYITNLLDHI